VEAVVVDQARAKVAAVVVDQAKAKVAAAVVVDQGRVKVAAAVVADQAKVKVAAVVAVAKGVEAVDEVWGAVAAPLAPEANVSAPAVVRHLPISRVCLALR